MLESHMSMIEQEKSRSPEELQKAVTDVYSNFPISVEFDFESDKKMSLGKLMLGGLEHAAHRLVSKPRLELVERMNQLISYSQTTKYFKEVMYLLTDMASMMGRGREESMSNEEHVLMEALQLENSSTGIFTKEGARKAEVVVFDWAIDELAHSIRRALEDGIDPFDPKCEVDVFRDYSIVEFKELLLRWGIGYKEFFGKSIDDIEDLEFDPLDSTN